MTPALIWGRFPSAWVTASMLDNFYWNIRQTQGIAALRVYIVLAHRLFDPSGIVRASYSEMMTAANLSRQSVANGLDILAEVALIERSPEGKGSFRFCNYDEARGWAKVPARPLYKDGQFRPFKDWTMRKKDEFDALKLYLFIAAARDNTANQTFTTYEKMRIATGVPDTRITSGLSLLTISGLVTAVEIERLDFGSARSYRLVGLDVRRHSGTTGTGLSATVDDDF